MGQVKVAIVDDHEAVRLGFAESCRARSLNLVASSPTVDELIESLGSNDCDVVVMDLSLDDGSSVTDNVEKLIATGSAVLIFSIADKPVLMRAALRAGALAIVPKSQPMSHLADAIKLAAEGAIINNPETSAMIDADANFKEANLSSREREVLSLYASGLSLKQVAFQLEIKQSSAKEHIDRVRVKYAKLGREAGTKVDLYRRAIEDGIISGDLL
ncbi:response regulator transcription factor [Aquiluna sp.]|nr:response regulator transcription factor [Aquiluna sp.]MDA8992834.1 response regulator transcription factor [Aquiluna sp.]